MSEEKISANEYATLFAEKFLRGKSYDFIVPTAEYLKNIAETTCKLPILTKKN